MIEIIMTNLYSDKNIWLRTVRRDVTHAVCVTCGQMT